MLSYMLLGVVLLLIALAVAHGLARADTKTLLLLIKWVVGVLAVLLGLYLLVSGRAFHIIWVALLLPALWRMLRGLGGGKPSAGRSSDVKTEYLSMILDHDSGEMSGTALKGVHAGRALDDLDLEELLTLYVECRAADERGAEVLEAYLDRSRFEDWRDVLDAGQGGDGGRAAAGGPMTADEAREILGLGDNPTSNEIKAAHRDLMQRNHPDRGGSTYLAAKINLAKELLLGP